MCVEKTEEISLEIQKSQDVQLLQARKTNMF